MSQDRYYEVDVMLHVTNCPHRIQGGQKYLDGSYGCKNVTGANCHSRQFIGWTDSVGQIVAWSVCWWTDRLGTIPYSVRKSKQKDK
jgi:hypothetical protein